ncbi:MAG: SRPBCC family protein [Agromyces sp.]
MPHAHLDTSITIHASAQQVFDRMNDLSRFNDWNPFPGMDPTTTSSHEGPASGVGAIFNYEGQRLGKGRMEISSVAAPNRIDIAMTFWRGGKATHSHSAFLVTESADGAVAQWTFDEERGFAMYLMGKLMFDKMMSGTFQQGLQKLKALVEAESGSATA